MVDAALWYITLLDAVINAYHTKITLQLLQDPTTLLHVMQSLNTFTDDVVFHAKANNLTNLLELMYQAQHQLSWWDQLI